MTTLATITTVAVLFSWILVQEWRQLTKTNRYVVKLDRAKANRRAGAA